MTLRFRLFTKYAAFIVALVGGALVVSGGTSLYFAFGESKQALFALQREKADAAAYRIEQYVRTIEHELGWTALPRVLEGTSAAEQRRIEFLKLLRQAPQITEAVWIDRNGREQVRVSRLAMDALGADNNFKIDPRVVGSNGGKTWFGPVTFRKDTEPYMGIARAAGGAEGGTTAVEVNLKFVWDVVSQMKVGKSGIAYVIDAQGHLVAHPDISLVLQKLDWTQLEQVKAALASANVAADLDSNTAPGARQIEAKSRDGKDVLAAYSPIPSLGWRVMLEVPLSEIIDSLQVSAYRTLLILLVGLVLSMLAALFLARTMVRPIRALQEGAEQIGAGKLDHTIEVKTGDELETLANQFNTMARDLKESYSGLERKVDDRTRELTETLEQQTATSEILRVIGSSPTDDQPVFDAIVQSAARLFAPNNASLTVVNGDLMYLRASNVDYDAKTRSLFPRRFDNDDSIIGQSMRERRVVHVPDVLAPNVPELLAKIGRSAGHRCITVVPLLRKGEAIGALHITSPQPDQTLTEKELALLQTFADQAVIAIENVRLFRELEARNSDLKETLEQQTATSEILHAISNSPTNTMPVFEAIARSGSKLFAGANGVSAVTVLHIVNNSLDITAMSEVDPERIQLRRAFYPVPLTSDHVSARAIRERCIVDIADIEANSDTPDASKALARKLGNRAITVAPMMRELIPIGAIMVSRDQPGNLSDNQIALLKTFANQAVIAIENVRLFNEIQDKSRQLELANKHKSEFLANMSHELRTPLNAIIGFSEVLIERMFGDVNDKQEEYLKDIHTSGQHLLSLINDILDLSKVEAGRMELNLGSFHLPSAIDNALTLIRERAQRHNITLKSEFDPALLEISADERKLKQILLNLLSNAVKFTPEGGSITVTAGMRGGMVEIAVTDTGVGIAETDLAAVFEEFKQVGTDYTRKAEGTGLGLPLAKRFVELHGGTMRLTSEIGKGSTFIFTLPLSQEGRTAAGQAAAAGATQPDASAVVPA